MRRRHAALAGTPLLVAGVALAASNLRPAVTSLASVLGEVRAGLDASPAWVSVLSSVPTICFGLAGLAAPWLGRKLGMARAVGLALAVLTVGLLVRVLDGPAVVLGGTFVACGGIAVCNVLIPVVVKEAFPNRIGVVTGVYTATMATGAGLGAVLTPRVEPTWGWRLTLAAWALLAAAALILWLGAARHRGEVVAPAEEGRTKLLGSGLAWIVTVFFGLQALYAYTVLSWLPEVLVSVGIDRPTAGLLLGLTQLSGIPISFIVPPLAVRARNQSTWTVALTAGGFAGAAGLLLAPAAAPLLWVALLGCGMGVFPLILTIISLRAKTPADTAGLSAMAQSAGYLIAAVGPFMFGVLHTPGRGWTVSLLMVLALLAIQMVFGWLAGRDRTV
ncbi:MFS transporter [Fodinicola acaciae]|uniref:MFS transporter n=1 Tax=Fodinicola acaciae TaxID=2681555 RepID=UPI0013D15148|nr:MFS transporter [Fodinicola acaciae]